MTRLFATFALGMVIAVGGACTRHDQGPLSGTDNRPPDSNAARINNTAGMADHMSAGTAPAGLPPMPAPPAPTSPPTGTGTEASAQPPAPGTSQAVNTGERNKTPETQPGGLNHPQTVPGFKTTETNAPTSPLPGAPGVSQEAPGEKSR